MGSMMSFQEKVRIPVLTICEQDQVANGVSTGLGFIMLLSGEPGVGKTLTAESG
jgi:MoxR-like ATPase